MTYDNESPWWEKDPFEGNGHDGFAGEDEDATLKGIKERAFAIYKGREFVLEADGIWRDERGATLVLVNGQPEITEITNTRHRVTARNLYGQKLEEPDWFMHEWILRGQTNGLYGVPGIRKSLWMLQAQIAGGIGAEFCGIAIPKCTTLGYYCEDVEHIIHSRSARILDLGYGGRDFDAPGMDNVHWHSLVGAVFTEFMSFSPSGTPRFSPEWRWFQEEANDLKPALINFDVAANFFGGNEIARRDVTRFTNCLNSVLLPINAAGLCSFHPSLAGIAQKTMTSGSTAWVGGPRSRLVMLDPTQQQDSDGEDKETPLVPQFSDQRSLIRFKSNYAQEGVEIPLEVKNNAYFDTAGPARQIFENGPLKNLAVEAKFIELLNKISNEGGWVNDRPRSEEYAAKVFARRPDRGGYSRNDFARALDRLKASGRIEKTTHGYAGKQYPAIKEKNR